MENSILNTIKSMLLGSGMDVTDFDTDLIVFINSTLSNMIQLGVSDKQFRITGPSETWDQLITNENILASVKEYIYIRAKLLFDPPTSSIVMEAYKEILKEDEWRITNELDMKSYKEEQEKEVIDYNDLINKPSLNGVKLQGDVEMDIASEEYVDKNVGDIENAYY